MKHFLTEEIILPLSDLLLGQTVRKHLKFLLKSQWWSKDVLQDYQNKKLKALIKHAYDNVPYYSELFRELNITPDDINTAEDLKLLPVLNKDTVRKNIGNGKLIARNIHKRHMIENASSGSTGEPLRYYMTKDAYSFNIAANLRGWYWMGYRLGDKYIKVSQNPRKGIKILQDKLNNCEYIIFQKHDEAHLKVIAEKLLRTKAEYIRGYPDPMFFIAKYLKENNIQIKKFKAVNLTGNTLFPDVRKLIEEVFQAPVFDSYSCEAGAIVFECPTHKCYHSCNEYAISEIQSEKSGSGRLITTDLLNYAVPFIRYDSQDILSAEENSCSCGRNLMPIRTIEGRDSDILITPKGKYLIVHNFTGYFEWIESVDQFQIVQQTKNEFLFRLKINNNFSDKIQNEIHKYWMDYIDDSIVITIETVKEIPLTSSGKRRFLIRDKRIAIG